MRRLLLGMGDLGDSVAFVPAPASCFVQGLRAKPMLVGPIDNHVAEALVAGARVGVQVFLAISLWMKWMIVRQTSLMPGRIVPDRSWAIIAAIELAPLTASATVQGQ